MDVPVVLLVYNRPDTTQRVFERIREVRPHHLLIVADGPRESEPSDGALCRRVREIVGRVDWPCHVDLDYSDKNLGCRARVSSGLDWAFSKVERAIILEDDCVPSRSFFRFCAELLDRYAHEPSVCSVSGDNFQFGRTRSRSSYYFSRYAHVWGWATWRRAWEDYAEAGTRWAEVRETQWLPEYLGSDRLAAWFAGRFDASILGSLDTWDTQWLLACWLNDRLTALPEANLVSNIGFGSDATHTRRRNVFERIPTQELDFPLRHPPRVVRDSAADRFTERLMFGGTKMSRAANRAMVRAESAIRAETNTRSPHA